MASILQKSTIYSHLSFEETNETENYIRKAKKKLREIAVLKKKSNKTPEEWEKIHQESDWLDIVKPVNISIEPTAEEVKERKEKQREKTKIKKIEKQLYDQKQKHKREIELLKKHFQEQNFLKMKLLIDKNTELKRNIEILNDKNKELNNVIRLLQSNQSSSSKSTSSYYQVDEVSVEEKIEEEFYELYNEFGSYRKVYIQMMKTYHPDKCSAEIAEPAAKVLSVLKQKHIK